MINYKKTTKIQKALQLLQNIKEEVMKKIVSKCMGLFLAVLIAFGPLVGVKSNAQEEMRAAWVSTVFNIDWPSKASYGNAARQKQEYISLIERLKSTGINTIIVQVRPESDAIYRSNINPWSRFLTGKQGQDPGYDPLEFIIEQSHNRGLKVHAWFNPYRASIYDDKSSTALGNAINKHSDWTVHYNGKWYYDPAIPDVTDYIADTVGEVVENYDVDGIHFDDYFYPGPGFPDETSYRKYGNRMNRGDWRRNNVNKMVMTVRDRIKSIKPGVEFGISPAGIWKNKSSDPNGSNTAGGESFFNQHSDTRYWIKQNLIDYVAPQVYWRIGHPKADYETLVRWWSDQVAGTSVSLYIGQGIYKSGQSEYAGENVAREIKRQLQINSKYPNVSGSIFFSAKNILNSQQVSNDIRSFYNNGRQEPKDPNNRLPYQNSMIGRTRADTAIDISKKGWPKGSKTAVLVNGQEELAGVLSSPLASYNQAPILLKYKHLSANTINELKRLGVNKLIIVGTSKSFSQAEISKLKSNLRNTKIESVINDNIGNLSIDIAKIIRPQGPSRVYVASQEAMVDVLSIAPKAGKENNPILITPKNGMSKEGLEWLEDKKPEEVYFIGGTGVLADSVISQVEGVLGRDLGQNRIAGSNRIDTNTKVIDRFYVNKYTPKAFLARSDAPIDAITVSALAQKSDSPVILVGNSVSKYQNDVLYPRSASLVYRVGGNINNNTYKRIHNLLGGLMK